MSGLRRISFAACWTRRSRASVIWPTCCAWDGYGVFVAEIGDITRFQRPEQLTSWAGLTPKHHEFDTTMHRGRLVRWAAVEAVQRVGGHTRTGQHRDRVAARRGRNIGVVAAARKLLTLVFYGLRDHHIRALTTPAAAWASLSSSVA
jgi:Transposase IS116/IS110/IS902 family